MDANEILMGNSNGQLVPFGKYKGQPVELLLADPRYAEWLSQQTWVKDRYPVVYQTIINYGGEPQDSSEHNEMQLSFLDEQTCISLMRKLGIPVDRESFWAGKEQLAQSLALIRDELSVYDVDYRLTPISASAGEPQFEVDGWDVRFDGYYFNHSRRLTRWKTACECPPGRYAWQNPPTPELRGHMAYRNDRDPHLPACLFANEKLINQLSEIDEKLNYHGRKTTIYVECKPQIGDDFPSILRTVQRYPITSIGCKRAIVVRRAAFERVTWDQVVKMFAASGIYLILQDSAPQSAQDDDWPQSARPAS